MLYNENIINNIALLVSETLKSKIHEMKFDIYSTEIIYENGFSIKIYCKDNKIKKIVLSTKKSEDTVIFNNDKIGEIMSPLLINSTSNLKNNNGLFYSDRREIRTNNPKYQYFGTFSSQYSTIDKPFKACFKFNSKSFLNTYKAIYCEEFKVSGMSTISNKKGLEFKIDEEGLFYLNSITLYLKELKKKYKDNDCTMSDLIKLVMLERKMREYLKVNFEEIVNINGTKEKLLRLKK